MSGSVNKVILVGRLGRDPEIRYSVAGQPIATLSIATSDVWVNKDGQREERTEWHRVVAFGKLAQHASDYLKKGRLVYVEGSIRTRKWEDRDGNTRYTTEIVASSITFLSTPPLEDASQYPKVEEQVMQEQQANSNDGPAYPEDDDDDLPF